MDRVNPILLWNEKGLAVKIKNSQQTEKMFDTLSKGTYAFLVIFGLGAITTFGMTNPSYFAITGTLIIVGYGPAHEVSVETLKSWTKEAKRETAWYSNILDNLKADALEDVPGLNGNEVLIAQWHTLAPETEEIPPPPLQFSNPEDGKAFYAAKKAFLAAKMENYVRKIQQAYLIHVAANHNDTKKIADFGSFQQWDLKHVDLAVPFAVFENILNTQIEDSIPAEIANLIFNREE